MLALTACTTTSGDQKGVDVAMSQPIVQQVGSSKPAVANLKRDSWVEIRKSSDSQIVKMYAALGASEWNVAISDARAYLEKKPKDLDALTVLAIGLAMNKQYQLAAYYAGLIETFHGEKSVAKNIEGLAIINSPSVTVHDYKKALAVFRESFDLSGNEIAAGLNIGHIYLRMDRYAEAVDIYRATRDRCGGCEEASLGLGIAQTRTGSLKAAKATFESIIEKNPEHQMALFRLALIEKNAFKNQDKAKSYLERLLASPSEQNLDIKRQANFVLRSMEASRVVSEESEEDAIKASYNE
jgi:tetratricopeptide (TPR) repeat protein